MEQEMKARQAEFARLKLQQELDNRRIQEQMDAERLRAKA